jgi:ribose transport system ATP-binding protein
VGAKSEIYAIIRRLADEGRAVLLISSDHQELFGLCDRVLVMGRGRIRSELLPGEFDEERLLSASLAIEPIQTTVRTDQNPAG